MAGSDVTSTSTSTGAGAGAGTGTSDAEAIAVPPAPAISDEILAQAALLAAVGEPNRRAVLHALRAGTTCVCDVQAHVPIPGNLLSYHLRILREAGLILATKRGRWVDYRLADDAFARLHAALPAASADTSVTIATQPNASRNG